MTSKRDTNKWMNSAEAYEAKADEFLIVRDNSTIGAEVVEQWAQSLDKGAAVVELACGGGYPVTQILSKLVLDLWAIESSPSLANTFRVRFPTIPMDCNKVQESSYFDRTFDGAIAIGLIFLLPEAEQVELISRVAQILNPAGRFLFSAPKEEAVWKDLTTGLESVSLGRTAYEHHLLEAGFTVVTNYYDEGGNNYYDVKKVG